jgi:leucine dehydrogenase
MKPLASVTRSGNGRRAAPHSARASATEAGDAVPPVPLEHEELVVRRGARSGVEMVVAIHSTALGPALGGMRIWHYRSPEDGVRDALRLSRAMTLKAAAAGLDLGGGKAVLCAPAPEPPVGEARRRMLLDFGDLVESLGGRYITAEDVGCAAADLVTVRERTRHVTGLPVEHGGAGDPSPYTARGVEAAMRACVRHRFGRRDVDGTRVVIVGFGNVGGRLARRLAEDGARLAVSDIDPGRRGLAADLDAEWLDPETAMLSACDVLAPCALGGAIEAANAELLEAEIVCGSANNQLVDDGLAERLDARGILYAPDFIANAGGLINVYRELRGYDLEEAVRLADGIEETMDRVLDAAEERGMTPLEAARELARERLETAVAA